MLKTITVLAKNVDFTVSVFQNPAACPGKLLLEEYQVQD
jgi:hypothetical protein